ncbi:MAG: TIM barrel protein [Armatimonadota bacterium]|nr:TIM barrel protein [Armatimonadota bacterium]
MLHAGLVSVTFRKLSPPEIVALTRRAGLEGIEWGGDVHVPHGDLERARQVRRLTEEAGLRVASYGSYYRVGHDEPVPFCDVLTTAVELGAPVVRVWAGKVGSGEADEAYRLKVVHDSRRIAEMSAREGITVAFEYHGNTLTDTPQSARRLLKEAAHPNLKSYWQPASARSTAENLEALQHMLPWLCNVHAFWWEGRQRRPLAEGTDAWSQFLGVVRGTTRDHWVMLEFVMDDAPEAFLTDAATLREWLR